MRVFLQQDETANVLDIGNNKVAVDTSTGFITLPPDFRQITDSKEELIQSVFPDIAQKFNNHNWLGKRAILAAQNKDVEDLNATIQNFLPGQNEQLQRVSELHRSYDALQYPILHWKGDDGYHINIPMIDPRTGLHIQKKVSAMNFYSYRLMVRPQEQNYILRCRKLYHQYIVDMYAKIETERLNFIRFNQAKLRSEQYIHLQDAIANDDNIILKTSDV
ncbi:uncharacterized protein LOC129249840 [Anastrepha obliqua]|uniref:uncharacterized protein LOC129249840 n=1 Tax=Anastrepha obliqua TaxID=95512 RepID=UPI00240A5C95|nr:uncharacterized protein LOC129249840 [Anastrepha obliqua]